MNGLPYYPRYPRDFLEGSAGLSLEVKGAYGIVLDLIYMFGERGLPDDPQYISGQLGCSVRKWNTIRKTLIEAGKITSDNEIISNFRADKEKIIQRTLRDKNAENRSRRNKNKDLESRLITESESDTNKVGGGSARASDPTFREKLLVAAGHDESGLTATGKIVGGQADMAEFRGAMDSLSLSEDEALAIVAEVMTQKPDGPPSRLKYFIGSMQRYAGARDSPAVVPISQQSKPVRGQPDLDQIFDQLKNEGRI